MSTLVNRAIVIFPECAALHEIEALRTVYDPLAKRIPAHLTLVFPFESEISTPLLVEHLCGSVAGVGPFAITLRDITGSDGEYLFLNIKRGNDALIALRDRLYSGILAPFLSAAHTYVPHLTVGRLATSTLFHTALAEARRAADALGPMEAEVRAISSYHIVSGRPRSIECTVTL